MKPQRLHFRCNCGRRVQAPVRWRDVGPGSGDVCHACCGVTAASATREARAHIEID
ncbi:MAG TPA: hypothetical protein VFD36_29360 [Kofleriaceae bacterium]|nr:hypothetical protein [Kofleriaceae bacterium]